MDIVLGAERVMGKDDAVWLRHANPWSVWTRIMTPLPLLIAAAFSRIWLGWGALVPIAVVMVWICLNPRLFAAPRDFRSCAAQGVLGERVFLRKRRHRRASSACGLCLDCDQRVWGSAADLGFLCAEHLGCFAGDGDRGGGQDVVCGPHGVGLAGF